MNNQVIGFHYTLKRKSGEVLDSSQGDHPLYFMVGKGQIIPGLESQILGLKVGDNKSVIVPADQGYGQRDERLVVTIPRSQLPKEEVQVGDHFQVQSGEESQMVVVSGVTETEVTLDGNHPLAGEELHFDVTIAEVREATEQELAHGHAHGPGGHHHH